LGCVPNYQKAETVPVLADTNRADAHIILVDLLDGNIQRLFGNTVRNSHDAPITSPWI
jgi:hypothetical protein